MRFEQTKLKDRGAAANKQHANLAQANGDILTFKIEEVVNHNAWHRVDGRTKSAIYRMYNPFPNS